MYESEVSSPVSDVSALCAVGVRHRASSGRVCECFEAGRHECARTDGMEAGLCFTRPDGGGMLTDTHFVVMGLCGAMLGIGAAALLWRRRSRQVCSIAKQKRHSLSRLRSARRIMTAQTTWEGGRIVYNSV